MAYYNIVKRPRADGTIRYRCTVGIKEGGKHIHRETKTFGKMAQAKTWGAIRSAELEQSGIPAQSDTEDLTVGDLLYKYINDPDLGGKAGRTKKYVLDMLLDSELAKLTLSELSVSHVIEYCKQRHSTGITPSTINHDVSYLTSVLKSAKPIYNIDYVSNPAYEARPLLIQMGLIGKSQRRSRRPVQDEIDNLIEGLRKRSSHREGKIPYEDILNFSILSCMRIGEVCKIRWDDIDEKQRSVIVRDRKDPRKKTGNHMSVPLLGNAWEVVQRQPRASELIFPYNSKSVTVGFQRVRNALGIKDLRYHDLRREGASRLFEAGFSIEEVAQVTGHRSLNVLWQVYTELYPQSLHDKFNRLMQQKENDSTSNT
ncbi:tyrosine-type recombinase/integrase [Xenorhabdus bovienii]|uniref:tyrosine-type recombinase/integrase n=1 Tax=Xenorhabdus bovienii TaxID=40576 RepID=UPI0023B32CFF|nr:site-specific integrase [Xenorhabdus bovienii]MDE9466369.1 site-specific integrase [Xenorhabdus bovienii]MDE9487723.1 site-specific integrase [Xenorhabdus bovienii]